MESRYIRKLLRVKGMVCSSCEQKIAAKLLKLNGVKDVKASSYNSTVSIIFDYRLVDLSRVYKLIEDIGYIVESGSSKTTSKDTSSDWVKKLGIITVIYLGYLVIQNTIGFSFIPQVSTNVSYGILFVTGLLSSFHCIAMCGGISLSQGLKENSEKRDSVFKRLRPSSMYNFGRIVSYTVIGGIIGSIGTAINVNGTIRSFIITIAGIFMIIMGMSNIFPKLKRFNVRLPRFFANRVNKLISKLKGKPFYVGLLNGLMPCGPLQAIQLYALTTRSFIGGALSMFMFSLGTVPLMLAIGSFGAFFGKKITHLFKISSILVVILGIVMINRGFALSGLLLKTQQFDSSLPKAIVKNSENIQEIGTTLYSNKFEPDSFAVKAGIPVKWVLDARNLNFCNNQLVIPVYNIQKNLQPGENTVEFTPKNTETIRYSCGMGMIRGSIQVVKGEEPIIVKQPSDQPQNTMIKQGDRVKSTPNPLGENKAIKDDAKFQTIEMTLDEKGYSTNELRVKRGQKLKWVVNGVKPPACIDTLVVPELKKEVVIKEGENIIKFDIPDGAKELTYTCPMGMIEGKIRIDG